MQSFNHRRSHNTTGDHVSFDSSLNSTLSMEPTLSGSNVSNDKATEIPFVRLSDQQKHRVCNNSESQTSTPATIQHPKNSAKSADITETSPKTSNKMEKPNCEWQETLIHSLFLSIAFPTIYISLVGTWSIPDLCKMVFFVVAMAYELLLISHKLHMLHVEHLQHIANLTQEVRCYREEVHRYREQIVDLTLGDLDSEPEFESDEEESEKEEEEEETAIVKSRKLDHSTKIGEPDLIGNTDTIGDADTIGSLDEQRDGSESINDSICFSSLKEVTRNSSNQSSSSSSDDHKWEERLHESSEENIQLSCQLRHNKTSSEIPNRRYDREQLV